ncbi:helix-turn-helix transcriptional regulator [Tenuibacillus multivorans]|nr:helix-turn-helix domain-containing protein [Tenuibacillus multivorans]
MQKHDQDKLWESVLTLADIDVDQAKAVFKVVIERFLHKVGMFTPLVSKIPLSLPSSEKAHVLRKLENEMLEILSHNDKDKKYELLVEYIDNISDLSEEDSLLIRRKILASILSEKIENRQSIEINEITPEYQIKQEKTTSFYTPKEVSKKMGLSDQTIRRMCEKGKFPGAYQTGGGHWKIPHNAFITTPEQDQKADELFEQINAINEKAGDADEFDL